MRVLVACEFSGIVRDAFKERGHDAWSCDLLPTERPGQHIQDDVLKHLDDGWDLMIAHPPCTYLSRAGARWWKDEERQKRSDEAYQFVLTLWNADISKIALENPIGQLDKKWRVADQKIEPHQFGDPYSKATCLWLRNLPLLMDTVQCAKFTPWIKSNVTYRIRKGIPQTGKVSGGKEASRTFPGIAKAMADQWGVT